MAAFKIGQMQSYSRDCMDGYFSKIPGVSEQYSGQFLVRGGNPETMEGENPLPDAALSLRFRTAVAPKAFGIRRSSRSLLSCVDRVQRSMRSWLIIWYRRSLL